ncbi:MAG: hypothetical protein AAFX56_12695 [Pseudomonadota bacterium]
MAGPGNRLIAAGTIAALALVVAWTVDRGSSPASDPPYPRPFDAARDESSRKGEEDSFADSGALPTAHDQIAMSPSAAPDLLMRLRERAEAGEGLAQYELSNELLACSTLMQHAADPSTITDSRMREFAKTCGSSGKSGAEFRTEARLWEERVKRNGVPGAVAMKAIRNLDEDAGDEAISQARAMVGPMLAYNDPYVYMAAGALATFGKEDFALEAAWHLLACEDRNDTAVCGRRATELDWLCGQGYDCEDMTIADYYYVRFPEDHDVALGIAMVLREKIVSGRYDEIWD